MFDNLAHEDFQRAYRRGFWRKLSAWFTGSENELLAYEEVRRQLPLTGQRDVGMREIPLDKIVGSVGRYRDFDRAFLPTQKTTSQRWINVDKARLQDVELPPIEVYKLGEVYFVKDGNHRVSVARERNQLFIDAYVTEVDVPIVLTPDMRLDDVVAKREYAQFLQTTGLNHILPEADLELSFSAEYPRLTNHIETHRWFLSREQNRDVSFADAAISWHTTVYLPLVATLREHNLGDAFLDQTETDLYLLVSEYGWLLRESYQGKSSLDEVAEQLLEMYSEKAVRKALRTLQRANWIDQMILEQDRATFMEQTRLDEIRPNADIVLSEPGKYDNLLRHITVHHYYLGLQRQADVTFDEAVASFVDDVYLPLLQIIHEQGLLVSFPERTEADLCLWVLDHRQDLVAAIETLPAPQ
jgi:hypothetical protein